MARILVAEDDPKQGDLLRDYLRADGHDVLVVRDGVAALDALRRDGIDLALVDGMMPGLDGLDVLRLTRAEGRETAVIMVTARNADADHVAGLELGADDYVAKPYSMRQLMARVRAVLRRSGARLTAVVEVAGLVIDSERCEVTVDGSPVELTARELSLLEVLAGQPGRVWSRQQLLDSVAGLDSAALERTIDMHVLNLRRKIERDPRNPERVLTVKGRGYKLADPGRP